MPRVFRAGRARVTARWNPILARHGAWLLALIGFALLLPGNNWLPLLDRDEPRFARATVEMMQRGEWVVPTFNADLSASDADRVAAMKAGRSAMDAGFRFDKPPLTYWLMRAGYSLFGVGEFGARFHSVVTAVLLGLAIFYIGRRWFNATAGFLAGFGFITCLQTVFHGRGAVADMPMALFVCLAMFALWELLHNFSWRWFVLLYVSLGLGFLAKGPIVLIVPVLAALLWRFALWRKPAGWGNLKFLAGLPITLAIIGAWGIPALIQTEGMFWRVGIGEHVVDRGMKAFNGRYPFPLYYCFTAFVSLFPWSFYAATVWRTARRERDEMNAFLLAWFLAPVLIFSFYATQLMHYILPGFAAFFLLLARVWTQRDQLPRGFRLAAIGAPLALLAAVIGIAIVLRPLTPSLVARDFLAQLPPDAPRAFRGYREASVVFYNGGPWQTPKTIEAACDFLAQPGPRALIVEESERPIFFGAKKAEDYSAQLAVLPTNGCETLTISGLNIARSKRVTVRVIIRR